MWLRLACLATLIPLAMCDRNGTRHVRSGPMDPPAFWVWHRSSPLAEVAAIRDAGVRTLYWQAAESSWDGKQWQSNRISKPSSHPKGVEVIPVFRLKPESSFLGSPNAAGKLGNDIRLWFAEHEGSRSEIQIDFDCPDRLLGEYARFLGALGDEIKPTKIGITALASWPRHPKFKELIPVACKFAPMFYDLETDAPEEVKAAKLRPMMDRASIPLIQLWQDCPRPWLAGLPNFERLSLFADDGKLIGHARGWTHDSVFFNPDLHVRDMGDGITIYQPASDMVLGSMRVPRSGMLVHRMPDAMALADCAAAAEKAGAKGILYFALPGPGIEAAYTAMHLTHPSELPRPVLEIGEKGTLVLSNPGHRDLGARRWEIEVRSSGPGAFQSASPGGFTELEISGNEPVELASGMVLRFSKLPTGDSIISGPLIRKPAGLTWRIRGLTDDQPLVSADSAR
jgi:hypothetical protein